MNKPSPPLELTDLDPARIAECIDACFACAQVSTACADACLSEEAVADLTTCIRANLDCADMCESTARLLSRLAGQPRNLVRAFLDTCAAAAETCGDECARHADQYEHCKESAEACRRAERTCRRLADALG